MGPATAASFTVANPGIPDCRHGVQLSITAKDAYGNTATGFTGSQSLVFSGPSNSPNATVPTANSTAFGTVDGRDILERRFERPLDQALRRSDDEHHGDAGFRDR